MKVLIMVIINLALDHGKKTDAKQGTVLIDPEDLNKSIHWLCNI